MDKKDYLKGLGIGMIVATLLMGIATKNTASMTDDEIKARAKELGMVEQKTLSDMVEDLSENPTDTEQSTTTEVQVTTEPPIATESPTDTKAPITTEAPVTSEEPDATAEPENNMEIADEEIGNEEETELIILEIRNGDSSDSVCARLKELGIIEDSSAFNRYLCNNGYDRKLNIGSYQLKKGMSHEEIAKIITRTR